MNFLQQKPSLDRGHLKTSALRARGEDVMTKVEEGNSEDSCDHEAHTFDVVISYFLSLR